LSKNHKKVLSEKGTKVLEKNWSKFQIKILKKKINRHSPVASSPESRAHFPGARRRASRQRGSGPEEVAASPRPAPALPGVGAPAGSTTARDATATAHTPTGEASGSLLWFLWGARRETPSPWWARAEDRLPQEARGCYREEGETGIYISKRPMGRRHGPRHGGTARPTARHKPWAARHVRQRAHAGTARRPVQCMDRRL
jgi:hypothetical protein